MRDSASVVHSWVALERTENGVKILPKS